MINLLLGLVLVLLALFLLAMLCFVLILINAAHKLQQRAEALHDIAANGIHSPHYWKNHGY